MEGCAWPSSITPTPSTSAVAVPLVAAQASPAPFPYERKEVEIESDEDSAKGPVFKSLRPTTATASHSSIAGLPASPRDQTPRAHSSLDLFVLENGGTSAPATLSALELPVVLQHALEGFQLEVAVDSDETAARERLGLNFGALLAQSNALITRTEARVALVEAKAKEETTLLARSFVTRETALKQELTSLRQAEKELTTLKQELTALKLGELWERHYVAIREADEPIHRYSHQSGHEQFASHRFGAPNQHHLCMQSREMGLWVLCTSEGNFGPYEHGRYHGIHDFLRERHRKLPGWHRRFSISFLTSTCLVLQIPAQFFIRKVQFFVRFPRRRQIRLDAFLVCS